MKLTDAIERLHAMLGDNGETLSTNDLDAIREVLATFAKNFIELRAIPNANQGQRKEMIDIVSFDGKTVWCMTHVDLFPHDVSGGIYNDLYREGKERKIVICWED